MTTPEPIQSAEYVRLLADYLAGRGSCPNHWDYGLSYDESVRAERPAIRLADEANRARAARTEAMDNLQQVETR